MLHYAKLKDGRYIGKTTHEILKACRNGAGYDKMLKATGTTRGTLHVLVHKLRNDGLLRVRNAGTPSVVYTTRKAGVDARKVRKAH